MGGTNKILSAPSKIKQIYNLKQPPLGILATLTPNKEGNTIIDSKGGGPMPRENIDPVVAFSRPPPGPPFLGLAVVLTLLETWYDRDGKSN